MMRISGTLEVIHYWCSDLILQFKLVREYRAAVHFCPVIADLEDIIQNGHHFDTYRHGREGFANECHALARLGNFDAALKAASTGAGPAVIMEIQKEKNEWIGTSGEVTAMVTRSTAVYSPPNCDALVDDAITSCSDEGIEFVSCVESTLSLNAVDVNSQTAAAESANACIGTRNTGKFVQVQNRWDWWQPLLLVVRRGCALHPRMSAQRLG